MPLWKVLGMFSRLKGSWKSNTLYSLFWLPFLRSVIGAEMTTRWEESRGNKSQRPARNGRQNLIVWDIFKKRESYDVY